MLPSIDIDGAGGIISPLATASFCLRSTSFLDGRPRFLGSVFGKEVVERGEPVEGGFGRISRAIITGSALDCLRFGAGPEIKGSRLPAPGADLRLLDVAGMGRL